MEQLIIKMSQDLLDLINQSGTTEDKLQRVIFYCENICEKLK